MKKLLDRAPLLFALICIGVYVVALGAADGISDMLGVQKSITAPVCVLLSAVLLFWMGKNGLFSRFGLCLPCGNAADYLYFLPMLLIISVNLWWGVRLNLSVVETVLYVISMLCVGFLEEILFRGFLFQALRGNGIKQAVIISSITFGIGHIVNLMNGAEVFATLLQILYAAAAGFLFTIVFYKSGSLLPCIVTHSAINSLSAFVNEQNMTAGKELCSGLFLAVVAAVYGVFIIKRSKKE